MKKRNLSDEEMKAIRDAIKGIVGNEDFDVEGQVITDRPNDATKSQTRKIIREMEDIARDLGDLDDRACKLVMDTLEVPFTRGIARVLYGNAFMTKMNLSAIKQTLEQAAAFFREHEDDD